MSINPYAIIKGAVIGFISGSVASVIITGTFAIPELPVLIASTAIGAVIEWRLP